MRCTKHIKKLIKVNITEKYLEIKDEVLLCTSWLIMCLHDLNLPLDEIIPNYGRDVERNVNFKLLKSDITSELMDEFYDIVIDHV